MRLKIIFSIVVFAFLISCNDKECNLVSTTDENRVSFEISFLDYSEDNFFVDEVYTDTSPGLNLYNLYYGNLTPIVQAKYFISEIEVYKTVERVGENGFLASARINLPPRAVWRRYSDSLRNLSEIIPGEIETGKFKLLSVGRDYLFNQCTGSLKFLIPINENDLVAVAYKIDNTDPSVADDLAYGEFFADLINNSDSVGVLKLVKPRNLNPRMESAWKLKMKNHYQIKPFIGTISDLELDIFLKKADGTETNSIGNVRLLELFGFDKLNERFETKPDGKFDYRINLTFIPQTQEIIFPVIEPFGRNIPNNLSEYKYQAIYDTLKNFLTLPGNSFFIKGSYKPL
ncbi:hypothetical protein [Ignavibacterium sp.]|uniref:hypothetical protein n=1 Tax=Ignavibacterium sp. TaxID=2651167 RepID=UPI00220C8970|nr:hypothetical protein [Ignavibacterium sp.]BDQ02648.1 MAG: hypothetical protein KatS3mg037_1223 [Ignavibacterium sp.]